MTLTELHTRAEMAACTFYRKQKRPGGLTLDELARLEAAVSSFELERLAALVRRYPAEAAALLPDGKAVA